MQNRSRYDRSRSPSARRRASSQRTIYFATGLFVVTILFIGILLLTSRDGGDGEPETLGASIATPANTAAPIPSPTATSSTLAAVTAATTPIPTASPTEAPIRTPTAEAVEEEEPTPMESDVVAEVTEEVEATEEVVETEEPVEVPEPTATPVVGEFGKLPPPQLVSGGMSSNLTLDYELTISPDSAPTTAPVYLLQWPEYTADQVAAIATSIGIQGDIEDPGTGSFTIVGDTGELYVAPASIQYVRTGELPAGNLGEDGAIVETARAWLYETGLIETEAGPGSIIGRDDSLGRAVVLFKPANPSPLLAFYPSASVTVGPANTILEANIRWPADYIGSDYGLRSGDELWNLVLSGQAAVEADLSGVSADGPLSGTMSVTDISIAYSYAAGDGNEYLVPLVVFSGQAQLNEVDASVPVSVYVSALSGQAAPRG